MEIHFLRLHPGDDLKRSLQDWAQLHHIEAATVVSGIGSLSAAAIRFAGLPEVESIHGDLEILTLQGIVADSGSHLHISVSDATGKVTGGHLGEGSIIRTTAEIALIASNTWKLRRKHDEKTGYIELNPSRN